MLWGAIDGHNSGYTSHQALVIVTQCMATHVPSDPASKAGCELLG